MYYILINNILLGKSSHFYFGDFSKLVAKEETRELNSASSTEKIPPCLQAKVNKKPVFTEKVAVFIILFW